MTHKVGILAYGSLITDPGDEIRALMIGAQSGVETPFNVEYARSSRERKGAPTLVPVAGYGSRVQAVILVLKTTAEIAVDLLYRREMNRVGSQLHYRPTKNPGINSIVVERLVDFHGVDTVLYTRIGANIDGLSPRTLARLAVRSARELDDGRDGISYLIAAKRNAITTPLSNAYEDEIKIQTGGSNLEEARRIARGLSREMT